MYTPAGRKLGWIKHNDIPLFPFEHRAVEENFHIGLARNSQKSFYN